MTLRINDTVKMNTDDRGSGFYRVQKIVADTRGVTFALIHEANVDSRNRNKEDDFKFIDKTCIRFTKGERLARCILVPQGWCVKKSEWSHC